MSDDLQSGPDPEEQRSKPQESGPVEPIAPAQETFGQFPEVPAEAASPTPYANPGFYNNSAIDGAPNNPPVNPVSPPFGYGPNNPFPGYGQPPNLYQTPPAMPPATPLPLWTAVRQLPGQYWYVLRHLQPATFVQEEGKAAWNIIWVQLLVLGVAEALLVLLILFVEFLFINFLAPSSAMPVFSMIFLIGGIGVFLGIIVFVPLSFFIGAGILHLLAKGFGGRASFLSYCYGYSLILTPISLASLALAIIPCIGPVAVLAGSIFEIVALIYMTMGIQRLSGGRASATVLIPVATGILLGIGVYIVYFIFLFSMIPHN